MNKKLELVNNDIKTVITIVLIAIVLGVGTIIVTNLMKSVSEKSECMNNGGQWINGECK